MSVLSNNSKIATDPSPPFRKSLSSPSVVLPVFGSVLKALPATLKSVLNKLTLLPDKLRINVFFSLVGAPPIGEAKSSLYEIVIFASLKSSIAKLPVLLPDFSILK